jgi:dolichyl-phosphate beta-glucosyltransferase
VVLPVVQPFLSIVVPAYNEAQRIEGPLRHIGGFLELQDHSSEVLVVDDGSTDGTADLVRRWGPEAPVPVRLLRYARNRGKGHALKVGFEHAAGDRIVFLDADLATPIEELPALLKALDEGSDLAIGSRKGPGARIEVHQPWLREQLGKVFTGLVRRTLADVSDVTCGFKAFQGDVGRTLFSRLRIHDWAFDAEILFLAQHLGYRIREHPVRWVDQPGTKVRMFRDGVSSLMGLLRILRYRAAGAYRRPVGVTEPVESWSSDASWSSGLARRASA